VGNSIQKIRSKLKQKILDFTDKIKQRYAIFQTENPKAAMVLGKAFIVGKWGAIGGFGLIILLILVVRLGFYRHIPTYAEMRKIQNPIASEVYAVDGSLLGRYYIENRTNASIRDIPKSVVDALVATEDVRFYKHGGVDYRSLMRVFFKTFLSGNNSSGGGSTITQQLAKNIYGRKSMRIIGTPMTKIWEMIVARRLEKTYSKDEIMELYLNTVSFGEDVYGVEMAAERYFNTKPKNLRIQDGAVLIGMLKATTTYNPRSNPERAKERRNVVFSQMEKFSFLEESILDSLQGLDVEVDYTYITEKTGLAPHLCEQVRLDLEKLCKTIRQSDGSEYNIYTDGLKVYTTIDAKMQEYAESAVETHMKELQKTFFEHWKNNDPWGKDDSMIRTAMKETNRYKVLKEQGLSDEAIEEKFKIKRNIRLFTYEGSEEKNISPWDSIVYYQKFLNTGFMAMNPSNGYIQAYVGSMNFQYFPYDHVFAKRQVGSIFKPIVYAQALENGRTPCDYIPNEKITYEEYKNWSPGNADGKYGGYYSIKGGLTNSVNTIAVQLIMENGISNVRYLAKKMGINSELPNEPSIALGTADISLYEMMKVYATFANHGKPIDPIYLLRVEDRHGKVLKTYEEPTKKAQVFSTQTADYMIDMMQSVVNRGTASRLRFRYGVTGQVAGKTGTTQDQADGWFMGFTPNLVVGAWVGGSNRKVRFRSTSLGQGASSALPICGLFLKDVQSDESLKSTRLGYFSSTLDSSAVDCEMYLSDSLAQIRFRTDNSDNSTDSDNDNSKELQELQELENKKAGDLTEVEVQRLEKLRKEKEKRERKEERKENFNQKKEEVTNRLKDALQKKKDDD
jgi:penicillin-binding protein 1A